MRSKFCCFLFFRPVDCIMGSGRLRKKMQSDRREVEDCGADICFCLAFRCFDSTCYSFAEGALHLVPCSPSTSAPIEASLSLFCFLLALTTARLAGGVRQQHLICDERFPVRNVSNVHRRPRSCKLRGRSLYKWRPETTKS